ncbi:MAG: response regulator [Treponema sp.]|jgi:signal transduction histidine kinase/DNA-binding response OmpR family regulator|nr:response regulator [Treponema sp.]
MSLSIRGKVILIISVIIAGMTAAGVIIGITLTRRNLIKTIENDLGVSGAIAEHLINEKIAGLQAGMGLILEKCRGLEQGQIEEVLGEEAAGLGYLFLELSGEDGTVLSYVRRPDSPVVQGENPRRVSGDERVSNPVELDSQGDGIIRFRIGEGGRFLTAGLPGTMINDMLSSFSIWGMGNIFVLNQKGTMIASIRPDLVFDPISFIKMAETETQSRSMADLFSRMINGETGAGEYSYQGARWICAYLPIQGTGGWSLGAACSVGESPLSQVVRSFLICGMVFFGLGIAATFFAAEIISHPFEKTEELALAAKSASEAKSHFLAKMSHEMRTPLNAIIGFSELELGKESDGEGANQCPAETRESLEKIYSSGVTLLGLINDILDISKIESDKFELVPANYDIPSLLNDTLILNRVRTGGKSIEFKLDIDENLPARLFGDELRIKQILNNLLSNAFKYTQEGTVTLRIRCERDGPGVWMTIAVSDTGIGIRKEDRAKIFGEYNRVHTSRDRPIEGTGLGLAITKGMAEMMKGSVSMESEYGKGSTFTVRILQGFVCDEVIGRAVAENLREFRYTITRQDRNKQLVRSFIPYARVLVVDDVETNLELTRGIMAPYGMTVDCVTSGKEAIDLIRKGELRYNAVFMDHMMPGMDGIEAVRIIRNEIGCDYARTLPIIALTADAILGNENLFLNNGFQDFLTKPVDIIKLDGTINRWVRDKKAEKELGLDKESLISGERPEGAEKGQEPALFPDQKSGKEDEARRLAELIRANPVEGLDVEKGLGCFGGDGKSFLNCLRAYMVHTPSLLSAIWTVEDLADYAITLHGIKGSSYGIAADPIGRDAEKLEQAAKAGDLVFIEAENEGFIERTGKFITDLIKLIDILEENRKKPRKPAPDPALLVKIWDAAENYDIRELDRIMEELERYDYERERDLVPWLRNQIDQSGFAEITARLMPLVQERILLLGA